jgi:hypothetical protein
MAPTVPSPPLSRCPQPALEQASAAYGVSSEQLLKELVLLRAVGRRAQGGTTKGETVVVHANMLPGRSNAEGTGR